MPVKKAAIKKSTVYRLPASPTQRGEPSTAKKAEVRSRKSDSLSVPAYTLAGRESGTLALPKEIFGQKVSKSLLTQAVRVYATNQKSLPGSTKTRGEVEGSTAKIYRQKGTGRARHGAIRAPIFVGGGIALGPKPRKIRLSLPQKMRKAALFGALSSKLLDKNIVGLSGLEKASGKTKEVANLVEKLNLKTALIVTDQKLDSVVRAARNIPGLTVLPANQLNAYEVLRHQFVVISKEAVSVIGGNEKTPESDKIDSGRAPLVRMTVKKGKQK